LDGKLLGKVFPSRLMASTRTTEVSMVEQAIDMLSECVDAILQLAMPGKKELAEHVRG
jgi:hypothetical protein